MLDLGFLKELGIGEHVWESVDVLSELGELKRVPEGSSHLSKLSRVASWGGGSLIRGSSGIGMQPGGEGAGEGDGDEGLQEVRWVSAMMRERGCVCECVRGVERRE